MTTYEYNADGVCINIKRYNSLNYGDYVDYELSNEMQIIGYAHWIWTSSGAAGGIDQTSQYISTTSEYYRDELLKETNYSYNDDGTQCLASKTEYKENGDYESVTYFENGEKSSFS